MTKIKKGKKDEVTIYYWKSAKGDREAGHIALQTHRGGSDGKGYYMSFYPAISCCLLSLPAIPLNFGELILPEKCHSCYIYTGSDGTDVALYYADRIEKTIKKIVIGESQRVSFKEAMLAIKKNIPLEKNELRKIKDFTNHTPSEGVIIYKADITRKGIFHTYQDDIKSAEKQDIGYGGLPDYKISLYTLDVDEINLAYEKFSQSHVDWNLIESGETRNCSGLAAFLLDKGGIKNLFTFWNKVKVGTTVGGLTGGILGGVVGGTTVITAVSTHTFLPTIGFVMVVCGTAAVSIPASIAAVGVTGLVIAGGVSGVVLGAAHGAICEYVYTQYRLGKTLVTPDDIFRLVKSAKEAEKDMYEFYGSEPYQRLIDQCQHYSSSISKKMSAVKELESLLEGKISGDVSDDEIRRYLSSHLDTPKSSIFEASFFRKSSVRVLFEECRDLINSSSRSPAV